MAEPAKIDLTTVKRGDTYIVDFYFSDTDGTKDISAVTIDAQARREMDGALWFDLKPVKVDASNGHFRIHLTHDETRAITESPPGSFSGIFDIQFSWQGAGEVYVSTIVAGSISISKDVTQPVILSTSGSSPMVPPSSQEVNVYLSLNPGSPNYSDVVTAEQLTPVQYDLSASLGLANVNAINEAGESAKIAKAAAAEALVYKNEARQSATLATMQATKATNEADRAKTEADKAKQVSGLNTVDQAVDVAMAEFAGMMSETEARAIQWQNENVNFDASGMVHTGKSFNAATYTSVNDGLFVRNDNPSYANQVYIGASASDALGQSKTNHAVTHIAGAVANVLNIDNVDKPWVDAAWNLPEAEDGTRIYDSTGDARGSGKASLDLKVDVDPKYGNAPTGTEAETLREAVGRAAEGSVKNGDFRLGEVGWAGHSGILNGLMTVTVTSSNIQAWSTIFYGLLANTKYVLKFTFDSSSTTWFNAYIAQSQSLTGMIAQTGNTAPTDDNFTEHTLEFTTNSNTDFRFVIYALGTIQAGDVVISNVSVTPVTEQVVTHRVDGIFIESYDEELTGRVEIMENIQSLSTTFGTTSVPTVLSTRKLSYFQQYDGQFPEVAINPDFINDRYRCVVWTDLTEPQKREIAAYMGEKLFMGVNGFPVNTRNRARTIRGAGNGDWSNTDSISTASNATLKCTYDEHVRAQGRNDSVVSLSTGWSPDSLFVMNTAQDNIDAKGVFSVRSVSTAAYQGRCFIYLVATVPRLNDGFYHENLNPYGSVADLNGKKWYETTFDFETTADCFDRSKISHD